MPTYESLTPNLEQHELTNEDALLRMPIDAEPLEAQTQKLEDGQMADVLARFRTIEGSYRDYQPAAEMLVLRDQQGKIAFRAINQHGKVLKTVQVKQSYKPNFQEIRTETGAPTLNVLFSAPKRGEKTAPILTIAKPYSYKKLRATTREGAARLGQDNETQYNLSETNRRKRGGRIRRWLAGLALVGAATAGTDATGGLYDMAGDAMSDAGTSVEHDFTGATPEEQAAIDHVARTMEDLDNHNNAAINKRANEFKLQHQDEFISDEKTKQVEDDIERAATPANVLGAVDNFMHLYGKTAVPRQENTDEGAAFNPNYVSLDILRQYALGVVDAYSFLPKKMVEDARFGSVEFASPAIDQATGKRAAVDGLYISGDSQPNRIMLVVSNDYGQDTRARATEVLLHESGHGSDPEFASDDSTGQELDNAGSFKFFLEKLVDDPDNVSDYAQANGHNEQYAEDEAHLLEGNDNNALAHPDDVRRFNSPANHQLLRILIQDDQNFPGIADYFVQHSGVEKRQNNLFNF